MFASIFHMSTGYICSFPYCVISIMKHFKWTLWICINSLYGQLLNSTHSVAIFYCHGNDFFSVYYSISPPRYILTQGINYIAPWFIQRGMRLSPRSRLPFHCINWQLHLLVEHGHPLYPTSYNSSKTWKTDSKNNAGWTCSIFETY